MDIHGAAREVIDSHLQGKPLPDLGNCGLCRLFSEMGVEDAYEAMAQLNSGDDASAYLDEYGEWTQARMTLLVLVAVTDKEDFDGHS